MSRAEKAPHLSTAIVDEEYDANLNMAMAAAGFFGLARAEAQEVSDQVREAVSEWRRVADSAEAPRRKVADLEDAFLV